MKRVGVKIVLISTLVVLIACLISAIIFPAAQKGNVVEKIAGYSTIALVLGLACFRVGGAVKDYEQHRAITKIVGAHPNVMPYWKWKLLAAPIAGREMRSISFQLKEVAEKENSLLKKKVATAEEILDTNKEIERLEKLFYGRLELFKQFGIEFEVQHWSDFKYSTEPKVN